MHVYERKKIHTRVWLGNLKGGDLLDNLSLSGRIIQQYFIKKLRGCGMDSSDSGVIVGGLL
jgi:hypothetical protein